MLVIGQCNRTVKGRINMSCLWKWTERVMCTHCCPAFFQVYCCCCSFFMKMYNGCLLSFSNFVMLWLIDNSCLICQSRVLLQTELDNRKSSEQPWQKNGWPWSIHGLDARVISDYWMRLSMISKTELNNCFIINFLEAFSYSEHLSRFAKGWEH